MKTKIERTLGLRINALKLDCDHCLRRMWEIKGLKIEGKARLDSPPSAGFPRKLLEGSSQHSPSAVHGEQSCSVCAPSLHYFPGASRCPPVLGPADAGPPSPAQSLLPLEHWARCKACGVLLEAGGGGAKQIVVLSQT